MFAGILRRAITKRGNSLQGGARCRRCGTNKNKPRFSLLLSGWASDQLRVGKITLKCFSQVGRGVIDC